MMKLYVILAVIGWTWALIIALFLVVKLRGRKTNEQ
jgi:hypothetical protein